MHRDTSLIFSKPLGAPGLTTLTPTHAYIGKVRPGGMELGLAGEGNFKGQLRILTVILYFIGPSACKFHILITKNCSFERKLRENIEYLKIFEIDYFPSGKLTFHHFFPIFFSNSTRSSQYYWLSPFRTSRVIN